MIYESKYAIGDSVWYTEPHRNIRHSGTIVEICFAPDTQPHYKVQTAMGVTYGVPESYISLAKEDDK